MSLKVVEKLSGKSWLLTGGNGFLGKSRGAEQQPPPFCFLHLNMDSLFQHTKQMAGLLSLQLHLMV